MGQFLKKHKLSQFTYYETDNFNSSITIMETEFIILKLSQKGLSWHRLFHWEIQPNI